MVHGKGTENLAALRDDRHRPTGAEASFEGEIFIVGPRGLSSDIGHDRWARKKDLDWRSVDCARVTFRETAPRNVVQVLPVRRDEEHRTRHPLELFLDDS